MSYGKKYTLTFRENPGTATTGNMYRADIYKNGYVGSTTSLKASDNPITLSYKKQDLKSPIIGSELTVGIMSTTNGQYLEFSTASPLDYYVDILISTDQGSNYYTYWSGVNTTDCYTEPYKNAPYSINLKFNCGLGELQWRRYENGGNLVNGLESLALTISNCLSFLPYSKNFREFINIREDSMDDISGFLEQTYLMDLGFTEIADDGELHGINCNKLLNQILTSLNCRMYQTYLEGSGNIWVIERIYERVNQSIKYFDYTPASGFQNPGTSVANIGSGTIDTHLSINNASTPKLIDGGDWAVTQKKAGLAYNFNTKTFDNVELIPNPFFEDTPTTKTSQGLPTQWDFGSKFNSYLNTSSLQLQTTNPYSNDMKYRFGLVMDSTLLTAFNADMKTQAQNNHIKNGTSADFSYNNMASSPNIENWGIHAVRRPGDTYTNPWVYLDPANGSLDFSITYYIRVRLKPTNWHANDANYGGDAYKLAQVGSHPIMFFAPLRIGFYDGSNNYIRLQGFGLETMNSGSWQKTSGISGSFGCSMGLGMWSMLNWTFPTADVTGQPTPLTASQFSNLLKTAYTNSTSVYLNYTTKYSFNIPLNPTYFGTSPGAFKFDFKIWPLVVLQDSNYYATDAIASINTGLTETQMNIDKFGIDTVDIQYKDNYQSMSGYTKFYTASDLSSRWNEEKISITFGDSITPGYPGSFRLSDTNPTLTWHNEGNSHQFKFSTSLIAGDPGTGLFNFNNATISSATHVYIDDTDNHSQNATSWLSGIVSGQNLVFCDTTSGNKYTFTTGTPVANAGYYDIPITYVSGSGTFSNLDVVQIAYKGGQVLADILFQNFASLLAAYRRNITGKIYMPGGVSFYRSIYDTDGTLYAQTGNQFDFKKGMLTVNMEEMSQSPPTVTIGWESQTTTVENTKSQQAQSSIAAAGNPMSNTNPINQRINLGSPNLQYPTG